jgi:hypothetical protein
MVHSREEQLKHERKHYDELKPNVVNVRRPHVNKQEWKEYHRDYRKKNTDKCKVWKLTYRSKHKQFYCICGGTCRWEDKARHLKQKQHLDFMKKYKSNDPHQLFECCEILYKHSKQMLSN